MPEDSLRMHGSGDDPIRILEDNIKAATDRSSILEKQKGSPASTAGERAGMRAGAELIGGILGGLMFGYFFDHMFDTRPYGLVTGLLVGVVAGFYGVYRYSQASR